MNSEKPTAKLIFPEAISGTKDEVDSTVDLVKNSVAQLREISPLWEMYQDGVDLDKIEWA